MKCKILILAFSLSKLYSQPLVTDGNNKSILIWDSSYKIETVRFFASKFDHLTDYQYNVKKDSIIVARYFRHDDSSFLFVKFDSIGRLTQRGIIKIFCNFFYYDTIQIPDKIRDPKLENGIFKDTLVASISYRKTGRWREVDSTGKVWVGEYINGKKEGIWQYGINFFNPHMTPVVVEIMYDNFSPLSKHLFKDDTEKVSLGDTAFWPRIKGQWTHKEFIDSNTIVFQRGTYPRPLFSFDTNEHFTSYRKPLKATSSDAIERYSASWKQDGDLIEIFENNTAKLIQVLSVTDDHLILKFLKW